MVNILVAEDDRDDFLLLRDAIENVLPKFNINHATDGKKFLEAVNSQADTDLIFLDLQMPEKSGIECLIELRQQKKLKSTPVIIYSISSDFDNIDKCYQYGCTLYLIKPNTYKDLVTQIRKIFFRLGLPKENLQYKEMFVVRKQEE